MNDVTNIDPPIEEFIDASIHIAHALLLIIVILWEEARRPQSDHVEFVEVVVELAKVLRGDLGDTVDIFRDWYKILLK